MSHSWQFYPYFYKYDNDSIHTYLINSAIPCTTYHDISSCVSIMSPFVDRISYGKMVQRCILMRVAKVAIVVAVGDESTLFPPVGEYCCLEMWRQQKSLMGAGQTRQRWSFDSHWTDDSGAADPPGSSSVVAAADSGSCFS
jgi:hypothetical protein